VHTREPVGSIDLEDATSLETLQEKSGTSSARARRLVHLVIRWPRQTVQSLAGAAVWF
jgi:hypothetical protein